MDRLTEQHHNWNAIRRGISGLMAAVLIVTAVGAYTHFHSREVAAKPTLDSITRVINQTSKDKPYNILEIVPGEVPYVVSINDCYNVIHEVSGNQLMGFLGYYVAGSEPVRSDFDRAVYGTDTAVKIDDLVNRYATAGTTLSDSNMRRELADKMFDVLSKSGILNVQPESRSILNADTYKEYLDTVNYVLHYDVYHEIRQGENGLTGEELETVRKKRGLTKELFRDYDGKYGEAYVDTAKGEMKHVDAETPEGYFIKHYSVSGNVADDPAVELLENYINSTYPAGPGKGMDGGENGYFKIQDPSNAAGGDFDPNLMYVENKTDEENTVSANVSARFSYSSEAKYGYIPYDVTVVNKESINNVEESKRNEYLNTPVYIKDNDVYVYKDTYGKVYGLSADEITTARVETHINDIALSAPVHTKDVLSEEESLVDELADVEDSVLDDSEYLEDEGILVHDVDTDNGSTDELIDYESNDVESQNNENEGDTSEVYYIVKFEYTEEPTHREYYQVADFYGADEEHGAQYLLDKGSGYGVIVPNYAGQGLIGEAEVYPAEWIINHFVYDYADKQGNYNWTQTAYALDSYPNADVYRIRGSHIYYGLSFTNNEWFKQYVFDREKKQCSGLYINVINKKASDVTVEDLEIKPSGLKSQEIKMAAVMSGDASFCIGDKYDNYDGENVDLSTVAFKKLLERVSYVKSETEDNRIPVIGDYRIVSGLGANPQKKILAYMFVKAIMLDHPYTYHRQIEGLDKEQFGDPKNTPGCIFKEDNNCHFVNGNIYIYNMKWARMSDGRYQNILNPFLFRMDAIDDNPADWKGFEKTRDANGNETIPGFDDVLTDIKNENLYIEMDTTSSNKVLLSTAITEATAIRYIIGYLDKRAQSEEKDKIRVLEIQPTSSYDLWVGESFWNSGNESTSYQEKDTMIFNKNGTFTSDSGYLHYMADDTLLNKGQGTVIELTRMSVAELIGHIEDINVEYDMIYIGMNTRLLSTDNNGNTKYNDTSMNGLIYTNIGDYIYMCESIRGANKEDWNASDWDDANYEPKTGAKIKGYNDYSTTDQHFRGRYSGNDITSEYVDKLTQFVEAGYPVILEDGFFSTSSSNGRTVNATRIDKASYMYQFANTVKDKKNVFTVSSLKFPNGSTPTKNKYFDFCLKLAKPKLILENDTMAKKATLPKLQNENDKDYWDSLKLSLRGYDNMYHASFSFKIVNKGAASSDSTYNVALYVDDNADGKYSHTAEYIPLSTVTYDGSTITGEEMVEGEIGKERRWTRYSLRATLQDESSAESSTDGWYYAECRLQSTYEGIVPWRLEITQNDNSNRRSSVTGYFVMKKENAIPIKVLQITQDDKYNNTAFVNRWGMATTKTNDTVFKRLLAQVPDYDVNITEIPSNKFVENPRYDPNSGEEFNPLPVSERTETEYYKALRKYDMLVLGFADCYEAPDSDAAMKAIQRYIESGRSVLFTHDCTSFINVDDMSRYNKVTQWNDGDYEWGDKNVHPWGYRFNKYIRNIVGMDRYNIMNNTDDTVEHKYDIAWKPGSIERNKELTQEDKTDDNSLINTEGFTYAILNRRGYYANGYPTQKNLRFIEDSGGQDNNNYHWVTKVNNGQITRYPFELADKFKVAPTHSQYYQLDFTADDDQDGEKDIVVWYCISDYRKAYTNGDTYELSPNDVRNNYYIYNKGNVTYCGVGHRDIIAPDGKPVFGVSDDEAYEIKLFINTLIAAYHRGLHEPALEIVNGYNGSRSVSNIRLSYDKFRNHGENSEVSQNGIIDETVDIYFRPGRASLVKGSVTHALSVKLYYKADEGDSNAERIKLKDEYEIDDYGNRIDYGDDPGEDIEKYFGVPISVPTVGYDLEGTDVGCNSDNLSDNVVYKATIPVDYASLLNKLDTTNGELWKRGLPSVSANAPSRNARPILVVVTDKTTDTSTHMVREMSTVREINLVRSQMFDLD